VRHWEGLYPEFSGSSGVCTDYRRMEMNMRKYFKLKMNYWQSSEQSCELGRCWFMSRSLKGGPSGPSRFSLRCHRSVLAEHMPPCYVGFSFISFMLRFGGTCESYWTSAEQSIETSNGLGLWKRWNGRSYLCGGSCECAFHPSTNKRVKGKYIVSTILDSVEPAYVIDVMDAEIIHPRL